MRLGLAALSVVLATVAYQWSEEGASKKAPPPAGEPCASLDFDATGDVSTLTTDTALTSCFTSISGTWSIVSNELDEAAGGVDEAIRSDVDLGSSNQWGCVQHGSNLNDGGLILRGNNGADVDSFVSYFFKVENGGARLRWTRCENVGSGESGFRCGDTTPDITDACVTGFSIADNDYWCVEVDQTGSGTDVYTWDLGTTAPTGRPSRGSATCTLTDYDPGSKAIDSGLRFGFAYEANAGGTLDNATFGSF